jgi:hypothetical protein
LVPLSSLVAGAFMDRTHLTMAGVAVALARSFTVFNYDRRGRGGSGDTQPYAVAREIEDLLAVVAAAGGMATVFGGSSRAGMALEAAGAAAGAGAGREAGHLEAGPVGAAIPRRPGRT